MPLYVHGWVDILKVIGYTSRVTCFENINPVYGVRRAVEHIPAAMIRWTNVGLQLGQCRRR